MEVVYILISFIEISVTLFLVVALRGLNKRIITLDNKLKEEFISFNKNFKKTAKILNGISKIARLYNTILKKEAEYKKFIKAYKSLNLGINLINLLKGKKLKKKFKILPIIRKFIFYV